MRALQRLASRWHREHRQSLCARPQGKGGYQAAPPAVHFLLSCSEGAPASVGGTHLRSQNRVSQRVALVQLSCGSGVPVYAQRDPAASDTSMLILPTQQGTSR